MTETEIDPRFVKIQRIGGPMRDASVDPPTERPPGWGKPDPDGVIADAQHVVTEARADVEDLRRRVVDGDETVTGGDLAEAEAHIGFAELRLEAAIKKAARETERRRRERIDAFVARVTDEIGGAADHHAQIDDLFGTAKAALDDLYTACAEHNAWFSNTVKEAELLNVDWREDGVAYVRDTGATSSPGLRVGDLYTVPESGASMLDKATVEVLNAHGVGRQPASTAEHHRKRLDESRRYIAAGADR